MAAQFFASWWQEDPGTFTMNNAVGPQATACYKWAKKDLPALDSPIIPFLDPKLPLHKEWY
jgi:hypothetical protein